MPSPTTIKIYKKSAKKFIFLTSQWTQDQIHLQLLPSVHIKYSKYTRPNSPSTFTQHALKYSRSKPQCPHLFWIWFNYSHLCKSTVHQNPFNFLSLNLHLYSSFTISVHFNSFFLFLLICNYFGNRAWFLHIFFSFFFFKLINILSFVCVCTLGSQLN